MNVFGVTGYKDAGKTELVSGLVTYFKEAGLKVSTIKRSHHSVDLDRPGTDTHRHREAGAEEVMLVSDARYLMMKELAAPMPLVDILERFAAVDLVLVEGFKSEQHPKIEAHRAETNQPWIYPKNQSVKAIATDQEVSCALPQFDLNDVAGIADFIQSNAVPFESLRT